MAARLRRFFRELRRRKIWNVLAVFVTVALGLLSAAEYLFPVLGFGDRANGRLAIFLLFAFPVVMVLGWVYDLTAQGLRRTQPLPASALSDATPVQVGSALPIAARSLQVLRRETAREPLAPLPVSTVPPDPTRVRRATLAQVRHDLSTPINAMIGYAEILLEENSWQGHEELRAELSDIRAASAQTLRHIDDALQPDILEEDGAATLDALVSLPAGLEPMIAQVQERALVLAGRATTEGLLDSSRDLDRIASAAAQLHTMVAELAGGTPDAASRQLENASVMAREVLASIQPVDGATLDVREGSLLVVDDNELNRDLLSRQLARQGYSVVSVASGPEAFSKLAVQEFDLILLDVLMSGMNGLEVLHRIKANQEWAEIPVLIVSALDELDSVVRLIELGADDYLIKPFDPVLLGARVRSNLRVRQVRRLERAQAQQLRITEAANARLLGSIAPLALTQRLSEGEPVFEFTEQASALYAELDGLANPGSAAGAAAWLEQINTLLAAFDAIADRLGVGFTRTADSQSYVAFTGLIANDHSDAESLGVLALEMIAETERYARVTGEPIHIRIGIHIGSALLGVPSAHRLRVHLTGEAIDVARQLAVHAQPGTAHLSTAAFLRLRNQFHCVSRGVTAIGPDLQMRTFLLAS